MDTLRKRADQEDKKPRSHERSREVKPQVVGLAHSSEDILETEWSEGAGLFKC